jgi:hypothetical protein
LRKRERGGRKEEEGFTAEGAEGAEKKREGGRRREGEGENAIHPRMARQTDPKIMLFSISRNYFFNLIIIFIN